MIEGLENKAYLVGAAQVLRPLPPFQCEGVLQRFVEMYYLDGEGEIGVFAVNALAAYYLCWLLELDFAVQVDILSKVQVLDLNLWPDNLKDSLHLQKGVMGLEEHAHLVHGQVVLAKGLLVIHCLEPYLLFYLQLNFVVPLTSVVRAAYVVKKHFHEKYLVVQLVRGP